MSNLEPYSTAEGEEETLGAAQMTKLNRFIKGARIKPSDHVLEIGTGWGPLQSRPCVRRDVR
jgi:cyclopropane-fatty-acyl-phospholipid synthase